jgi:hypothetical protein
VLWWACTAGLRQVSARCRMIELDDIAVECESPDEISQFSGKYEG